MAKNRFALLLEEKGLPAGEISQAPPPPPVEPEPPPPPLLPVPPTQLPEPAATQVTKHGKRADPDYRQISTYVRSGLYKQVRKRLTDEERDFSELLDELLTRWIAT